MLVSKIAGVFCMATALGVLYRIPRSLLLYGSLTGTLAWLATYGAAALGATSVIASFIGSVLVGVLAEILARLLRKPATIFLIPGFIPLVPGREAYTTMRYLVEGNYMDGIATGVQTMLTGGSIAFGIFVSSTVFRLAMNYKTERS